MLPSALLGRIAGERPLDELKGGARAHLGGRDAVHAPAREGRSVVFFNVREPARADAVDLAIYLDRDLERGPAAVEAPLAALILGEWKLAHAGRQAHRADLECQIHTPIMGARSRSANAFIEVATTFYNLTDFYPHIRLICPESQYCPHRFFPSVMIRPSIWWPAARSSAILLCKASVPQSA